MRWIGARASLVSTMLVGGLVADLVMCSSNRPPSSTSQPLQGSGKIVVFAAASLKPTFTRISAQFEIDNPGANTDFDFAGSSELAI